MKYFINLFFLMILLNSCVKEKKTEDANFDNFSFYEIKEINGIDRTTKTNFEIQVYESLKGKKFVNQVKQYKNEKIDSSMSHFYNLEYKEIKHNNYRGKIQLMYETKKILEIEFKVITNKSSKPLTFKSNISNNISFEFSNTDSLSPIKGVLCFKIETEILIGRKKRIGYYEEHMFVDSNKLTDNLFIKKYKK